MTRNPFLPLVLVTLAAAASGAADGFKVTTDRTVDSSSLETIVADVIRLSGAKSNDEKGIALYNYLHQVLFHCAYACEKNPQTVGPLKVINVYGWGLCGGEHTVMKAVFETAGWQVRYRGWSNPGHTTVECNYDGRWHYFDVFLKAYFWTKDRKTIAGQDDIIADPSIVLDGLADNRMPKDSYLCCGDDAPGIVTGCKNSKAYPPSKPVDGWASVTGRDEGYSPLLRLPSGATLKLDWSAPQKGMLAADQTAGVHTCPNLKDIRSNSLIGPILEHYGTRTYANGTLVYAPDFSKTGDLADIALTNAKPAAGLLTADGAGSALFKLDLPYALVSAHLKTKFTGGDGTVSFSLDGGKTWTAAAGEDIAAQVRQHYSLWVKVGFAGSLTSFAVEAVVEHNRAALPFLYDGKNVVTVATTGNALPANTVMTVTYSYQEATAPANRKQWNGSQVTYGEVKTVIHEVTALPSTFTIDVGGTTPPRMVSFERALKSR